MTVSTPRPSAPSPMIFFETINAFHRTAVMKGAIDLEIFTHLSSGTAISGDIGAGKTAAELAQACDATEKGVRVLCDYLTVMGCLTKTGDRYTNTQDSAMFLSKKSHAYVGGTTQFLLSPTLREAFDDVAACVRKGGTMLSGHGTVDADDPVWVDFAHGMIPMMMPAAQEIARVLPFAKTEKLDVLDIAAGHGIFGIVVGREFPASQITALDWEAVLAVAQENARKFEVSDRYRTLPGSAFEVEFGTDRDVVLLTNFLHHFDPQTCVTLLKKVKRSLKPGGVAVTLEFIPNPDRVAPPPQATFSMIMLCSTPSGDAYTFAELDEMFVKAGFANSKLVELPGGVQRLVVSAA